MELGGIDPLQANGDTVILDQRPGGPADDAGVVQHMRDLEGATILGECE
jgi:hypothetical protein